MSDRIFQCARCDKRSKNIFIIDTTDNINILDSIKYEDSVYSVIHLLDNTGYDYFIDMFNEGDDVFDPNDMSMSLNTYETTTDYCVPVTIAELGTYLCDPINNFIFRNRAEYNAIIDAEESNRLFLEQYVRSNTNRFYEDFQTGVSNLSDSDNEDASFYKGVLGYEDVRKIPVETLPGGDLYDDLSTIWAFQIPQSELDDDVINDNVIFGRTGILSTSVLDGDIIDINSIINTKIFNVEDTNLNYHYDPSKTIFNEVYGPEGTYANMTPCGSGEHVFMIKTDVSPRCGSSWNSDDLKIKTVNDNGIAHYDTDTLANTSSINLDLLSSDEVSPEYEAGSYIMKDVKPYTLQKLDSDYLTSLPIGTADYLYDCERALFGDSISLQNHLNEDYDVDSSVIKTEDVNELDLTITAALNRFRDYKRIGSGTELLWISYTTENVELSGEFETTEASIDNITQPILLDSSVANTADLFYNFEQVEIIAGMSRGSKPTSRKYHKSNIFSIKIKDSGLNENISDPFMRDEFQKGVEVVIRESITTLVPSHTQLWKIIWSGE